jgi:hypothetical protein
MKTTLTHTTRPAKLADFLPLMQAAECWTWSYWDRRRGAEITVYLDDIAADKRLVYRLRVSPKPSNPRYEVTKLTGYDPEKHVWSTSHGTCGPLYLPDQKGWKAIQAYAEQKAREAGRIGLGTLYTHYNR